MALEAILTACLRERRMQNALVEPRRTAKPDHVAVYLQHHRRELLEQLDAARDTGVDFARRYAQVLDGLVVSLF